jgi:hypothetical protein
MKSFLTIALLLILPFTASAERYNVLHLDSVKILVPHSVYENGLYLPEYTETDPDVINEIITDAIIDQIDRFTGMYPDNDCWQGVTIIIKNDFHFRCKASASGFCVGMAGKKRIWASLYNKQKAQGDTLVGNIPTWTVKQGIYMFKRSHYQGWLPFSDWYYWGEWTDPLNVIPHELEHVCGLIERD